MNILRMRMEEWKERVEVGIYRGFPSEVAKSGKYVKVIDV